MATARMPACCTPLEGALACSRCVVAMRTAKDRADGGQCHLGAKLPAQAAVCSVMPFLGNEREDGIVTPSRATWRVHLRGTRNKVKRGKEIEDAWVRGKGKKGRGKMREK